MPKPLRGNEIDSFAHDTIIRRLPNIAQRVLDENTLTPTAQSNIQALIADIPQQSIRMLTDTSSPDWALWQAALKPFEATDWLDITWFMAETYFYRRILEAVDFFQTGLDPFIYQKEQGLVTSQNATLSLAEKLNHWIEQGWDKNTLIELLAIDLWGNQADLSLWPAGETERPDHDNQHAAQDFMLVDNRAEVAELLDKQEELEIHFLIDNAGFELVCDLALTDYLLGSRPGTTIHYHLKLHPTFVSDALPKDVHHTIRHLQQHPATQAWGNRLHQALANNQLQFSQHPFWTSPHPAWDMPPDLHQTLQQATLVISKGDANYRRLLGDSHWPFTTPFSQVVNYFPAPLLALRTCKSEIVVGLEPNQLATLPTLDENWLTSGRWGVCQFAK